MLQQIRDELDIGVGQHIALVGLGSAALVTPPGVPCSHHQGEVSYIALVSSPLVGVDEDELGVRPIPLLLCPQSWFFHT